MVQSLMRTLGAVDGWPAILVRLTKEDDNRSLTLMLSRKILPLGPELNNLECTVRLQYSSQSRCSQCRVQCIGLGATTRALMDKLQAQYGACRPSLPGFRR